MREIKREPLGIRKLDVQEERRQALKDHKVEAERMFDQWFTKDAYSTRPMPMTRENLIRFAEVAFSYGWERGIKEGAKATRDRVAESLENGRLVKTR